VTDAATPRAGIIEIYERRAEPAKEIGPGSIIAPNEIRLNGVPLYCPEDSPVVVERIAVDGSEPVRVTLTLYARRVIIDDARPE
jgi:hypothetical protein